MCKNASSCLLCVKSVSFYHFKLGFVHVVLRMAIKECVGTHFQKWRSHPSLQSHFRSIISTSQLQRTAELLSVLQYVLCS